MSVVHSYDLPQVVQLGTGLGSRNMNYPVNRADIYLAKYVRNDVDFFLKDIDRRPVVTTETPILRIAGRRDGILMLTIPLALEDGVKARYRAVIDGAALADWPIDTYTYAVTMRALDGSERLVYTDRGRTEIGFVEVRQGPIPPQATAIEIPGTDLIMRDGFLYTGAYPGAARVGNLSGIMTAAVYGNHFTGEVTVQGSLDDMPSLDDLDWFDVATFSASDLTGVDAFTFEGNLTWVRFKIRDLSAAGGTGTGTGGGTGGGTVNCLGCIIDNGGTGGSSGSHVDWPPGTPIGLVKIVYRPS